MYSIEFYRGGYAIAHNGRIVIHEALPLEDAQEIRRLLNDNSADPVMVGELHLKVEADS
jgi:hypothetical protein